MHSLAVLYTCKGDYVQAEAILTACLEKREEVLGADHPHTIWTRECLADVCHRPIMVLLVVVIEYHVLLNAICTCIYIMLAYRRRKRPV